MKRLTLKYAGECVTCGAELAAGAEAIWWSKGRVSCLTCDGRMTREEYAAQREAKVERYQQYADNAESRSTAAYTAGKQLADMIPLGQPILVGHHSEGRARRDQARIARSMHTSYDEHQRAEHWQQRADAARRDRAIHSDDPDATDKLRAKITELEAQRDRMKAINTALRKAGVKKGQRPTAEQLAGIEILTDRLREALLTADYYSFSPVGFDLSYLNANIRRYRQRLAELDRIVDTSGLGDSDYGSCPDCGEPFPGDDRFLRNDGEVVCQYCL